MEIVDTIIRRRINIAYLQETKWVGEKFKNLKIHDIEYGSHKKKIEAG